MLTIANGYSRCLKGRSARLRCTSNPPVGDFRISSAPPRVHPSHPSEKRALTFAPAEEKPSSASGGGADKSRCHGTCITALRSASPSFMVKSGKEGEACRWNGKRSTARRRISLTPPFAGLLSGSRTVRFPLETLSPPNISSPV